MCMKTQNRLWITERKFAPPARPLKTPLAEGVFRQAFQVRAGQNALFILRGEKGAFLRPCRSSVFPLNKDHAPLHMVERPLEDHFHHWHGSLRKSSHEPRLDLKPMPERGEKRWSLQWIRNQAGAEDPRP